MRMMIFIMSLYMPDAQIVRILTNYRLKGKTILLVNLTIIFMTKYYKL